MAVVAVLVLVVAAAGWIRHTTVNRCPFEFDRRAWDGPSGRSGATPRQRQVDGLLRCHVLDNLSRREVRGLLGPGGEPDHSVWEYVTGPERGISVDNEVLYVTFGADDRVTEVDLGAD